MNVTKLTQANGISMFRKGMVISSDRTPIGYRYTGSGPGLIIIHDSLRSSAFYESLGASLTDHNTVYIPDRRGYGDSGPAGAEYTIQKEIEDLQTLMESTGARIVFGHGMGGVYALEAALQLPIEKLVLYEPAISIQHSLPLNWLPAYDQALKENHYAKAMAILMKGLPMDASGKLPQWMLQLYSSLLLAGDKQEDYLELLPGMVWEGNAIKELDSTYERYAGIKADTLLLGGTDSPLFLLAMLPLLAEQIPVVRVKLFPGQSHTAPDIDAPQLVALHTKDFLSNPQTIVRKEIETKIEVYQKPYLLMPSASLVTED